MRNILIVSLVCINLEAFSEPVVKGRNFEIPATQQIRFVTLKRQDPSLFGDKTISRVVDLKPDQSKVNDQGGRGACTYFVVSSLVESLVKVRQKEDIDVSEEYLAWASKVKMGLRSKEEDSSQAVNAATIQEFGFLLEKDLPYQPSWFDEGYPCAGQKENPDIEVACFAHHGPINEAAKHIISGDKFVFEAVGSSSSELVRRLARHRTPVGISVLGHPKTWDESNGSGELVLTPQRVKECEANKKLCGGHAVLAVGYDLNKKVFTFKNSWGEKWGNKGYGTISFDYVDQMSDRKFVSGSLTGNLKFP